MTPRDQPQPLASPWTGAVTDVARLTVEDLHALKRTLNWNLQAGRQHDLAVAHVHAFAGHHRPAQVKPVLVTHHSASARCQVPYFMHDALPQWHSEHNAGALPMTCLALVHKSLG